MKSVESVVLLLGLVLSISADDGKVSEAILSLIKLDNPQAAETLLAANPPATTRLFYLQGIVKDKLGKKDEALAAYKQAILVNRQSGQDSEDAAKALKLVVGRQPAVGVVLAAAFDLEVKADKYAKDAQERVLLEKAVAALYATALGDASTVIRGLPRQDDDSARGQNITKIVIWQTTGATDTGTKKGTVKLFRGDKLLLEKKFTLGWRAGGNFKAEIPVSVGLVTAVQIDCDAVDLQYAALAEVQIYHNSENVAKTARLSSSAILAEEDHKLTTLVDGITTGNLDRGGNWKSTSRQGWVRLEW
jgi:tetratricopeptide (TPR) repeat protein